ncbi:predicted protein [Naegleria gruberi]|uniref:Predicted protein n=1 Tax=Naegleria gruberi TaxID=5762 RepID=D2VJW1_NAEGR|nr:uncharacterized protein NAEGRDRAFT_69181 [Naegleria gruberi]EFC42759.1 predicted protein [Naegleria gruberi]|eukprot:XP_002675503.1 predicted protein [Naegleria gruberi strain NEG-M]
MISFTPTGILGLKDLGARIEKDAKSPGFLSPRGMASPATDVSPKTPRRGTILQQNENGEPIRMFEVDDYELQFVEMMEVPESRDLFLTHLQSFSIPEVISFLKDMWKYKEKRKNIYNGTTMKIEHSTSVENLQSSFASTFSLQRKTVTELHKLAQDMIGLYIENDARLQLNISSEVSSLLLKRWGAINHIKNTVEVKQSSFAKSAKSFFNSESNESDMFSIDLDTIKLPSTTTTTMASSVGTSYTSSNNNPLTNTIVAGSLDMDTILDETVTDKMERSSSVHSMSTPNLDEDSGFFVKCLAHALPNQIQETVLKLCQLFDSVEFYVYNDLALEHFPKFKKSKEVKNFLLQKGEEFTKKISINMKLGYELDIRYKAKDFVNPLITDKDIYFTIMLCTDAYKSEWQLLGEKVIEEKYLKTSYQAYISNQKFLLGEENSNSNMKLAKIDIQLPFPVDEAYKVALDRKAKLKCDPITLGDFDTYKVDDLDVKRPLSIAFSSESYNIGKLYKTREATFVQTLVFDRKTNCYINIAKTAEFEEKKKSKDKIPVDLLYAYMFKHSGPNKCTLTYIYFGDLKLSLDTDMFFKRFIKDRAKALSKGFSKILAERTSYGNHSWNESVDDVFCLQECLEKNMKAYPQRSWFDEYNAYLERSKTMERANSKQNLNN